MDASDLHYSNLDTARIPKFELYGERALLPDVVHCETIADRSSLHGWAIQPHRHERLHQFLHLAEGSATVLLEDRESTLLRAAVVNLPAGSVHGFRFVPQTKGTVLTVPVEALDATLGACPMLGTAAIVDAGPRLATLFGDVADEFAETRPARSQCLAAVATLIAARVAEQIAPEVGSEGSPLIRRFEALLETHYRNHWRVADYASALGISTTHLSRLTRAEMGGGASRVIEMRLMKEARRLLAYTAHPVGRIAVDLGFVDPAYFTRAFTRSAGMTPSAFRARVAEGPVRTAEA
ncbi:helix-turn-helix domain-containing protein [Acuticoccus sp. I52.16.1]|uniref:helix-turn-helix domain-containing protein n=1 Tax=Acuticoccus sp. I52.16.1 TaxID=2928472 RepID=UPI001FD2A003|nr:helix-turn-helix domain-containing protein [Acuticoccus sp. I52.16.1]UOM35507.1 helix-turn-helix domain-containing protein [Acuticoccus sp. I52.16.1]